MSNEILINANGYENRIALVENGVLLEVLFERSQKLSIVGNIYKGRVEKVLPGLQAAFVNIGLEKSAFMHISDIAEYDHKGSEGDHPQTRCISRWLYEGQSIVVQVYKDHIGTKGARITTQLSIPSRYLVMMPNDKSMTAISARITEEDERDRLTELLKDINGENPAFGLIARTNSEGASKTGLFNDLRFLKKLWNKIAERVKNAKC